MSELITCQIDGAVTVVTINRPKALNALNLDVLQQLYNVMDKLDHSDEVRVAIITGAGDKAFVAGADVAAMSAMAPEEALEFAKAGHRTMERIAAMQKVTIAAVNGFALGGGCELAMACDIRIASSTARMGIPEVSLGVIPGFGGTQRLPRLVGLGMAMELLTSGRQVTADEAREIGLINQIAAPKDLMPTCMKLATRIAGNSASAIALGKQAMCSGLETDLGHGLELEQQTFALAFATMDQKEGMSAFLEKRQPNFS